MTDAFDRLKAALADRYCLERELGTGGMATVYLARDLKHDRQVALKVMRPELSAILGGERFLREIRIAAKLNHPHVLQLYDSGEADSFLYYVMPYVEGESLRDRLLRERQLSIEKTIEVARGVASALDYAHRQGVVHRDIKPENVLLVDDQPLIADFGIALAVSVVGGNRLTETGLSLGTPHYMSPEQAMGDRIVDGRTDIYALGCVVYEMLVGEPPFTGPTAQAIIAKVIAERIPSIVSQRGTVPTHLEAAVQKALAKLPADRFATASEFAVALGRNGYTIPMSTAGAGFLERLRQGMARLERLSGVGWAVAAVAVATTVGLAITRTPPAPSDGVVRFAIRVPAAERLGLPSVELSPDGRIVVLVVARGDSTYLARRSLDSDSLVRIPGTESANVPVISPDGGWVAFESEGSLWKVPMHGGTRIRLADAAWGAGDWGDDGSIIYTPSYKGGLWRVSSDGADARELTRPDSANGELGHFWPRRLPDDRGVLFTAFSVPLERANIEVLRADGWRKVVVRGALFGEYLPTGHLVFMRGSQMMAVGFDLRRLETSGTPVPVVDGVVDAGYALLASYATAANGTLAYISEAEWDAPRRLVWVDRSGRESSAVDQLARYSNPRLSPDGRRLAVALRDGTEDVWVYAFERASFTRLTRHSGDALQPVWTPDGTRLIYVWEAPVYDLHWRSADGSGGDEVLLASSNDKRPGAVTPDGKYLVFVEAAEDPADIVMLALDGSGDRRSVVASPYREVNPDVSPDGRWLAYASDESGRSEVYVVPFPDAGRRTQVSADGGAMPRWTRGGSELVYMSGERLLAVDFDRFTGVVGQPTLLFTGSYFNRSNPWEVNYDVSADGSRFLMVKMPDEPQSREVEVILNWFEELRARVGR